MRWNKKYVCNKITDMKKKGLEGGKEGWKDVKGKCNTNTHKKNMLYVPPINTTYFFDTAPRKIKREKEERKLATLYRSRALKFCL